MLAEEPEKIRHPRTESSTAAERMRVTTARRPEPPDSPQAGLVLGGCSCDTGAVRRNDARAAPSAWIRRYGTARIC
jgi:hypothetical protein